MLEIAVSQFHCFQQRLNRIVSLTYSRQTARQVIADNRIVRQRKNQAAVACQSFVATPAASKELRLLTENVEVLRMPRQDAAKKLDLKLRLLPMVL